MRLGWMEILVILILLVILFGHKAIPGMMKNVADGINVFKKELKDTDKKAESKNQHENSGKKKVKKATISKKVKNKAKK